MRLQPVAGLGIIRAAPDAKSDYISNPVSRVLPKVPALGVTRKNRDDYFNAALLFASLAVLALATER